MPHKNEQVINKSEDSSAMDPTTTKSNCNNNNNNKVNRAQRTEEESLIKSNGSSKHCISSGGGGKNDKIITCHHQNGKSVNSPTPVLGQENEEDGIEGNGLNNGHLRLSNGKEHVNANGTTKKTSKTSQLPPTSRDVGHKNNNTKFSSPTITNYLQSDMDRPKKKIYKVVLTGGPCGGKTTGQARLCTFFENLGWKVYRVPEAATILLGGGIKFSELTEDQAMSFQGQLLRTMMQVENVFFAMAEQIDRDVLVICDRGAMDASAFIRRDKWEDILHENKWNEVELRDTRYNQIIHMVSAANGAETFYTLEDHCCRSEGLELARELDQKAAQSWVGHPYFDVVDNSTDFDTKLCRMIQCVCQKLGIDVRDRLQTNAKKVKFLVKGPLQDKDFPPGYQDFTVVHDYLQTNMAKGEPQMQARLRKRGQKGNWSYTYTVRRPEMEGQVVEVKTQVSQRDYNNMLAQKAQKTHVTVYKTRRCFLLNDQYFQLDVYEDPCHKRCKGLILLETYSTLSGTELQQRLPSFLNIIGEVTGQPRYSMFNLSLKDQWKNNKNFCLSLAGSDPEENGTVANSENCLVAGC